MFDFVGDGTIEKPTIENIGVDTNIIFLCCWMTERTVWCWTFRFWTLVQNLYMEKKRITNKTCGSLASIFFHRLLTNFTNLFNYCAILAFSSILLFPAFVSTTFSLIILRDTVIGVIITAVSSVINDALAPILSNRPLSRIIYDHLECRDDGQQKIVWQSSRTTRSGR